MDNDKAKTNDKPKTSTTTKILVAIVVIILCWNLYKGLTVQEIGIPNVFVIKFGTAPTQAPIPTATPVRAVTIDLTPTPMPLLTSKPEITPTIPQITPTSIPPMPTTIPTIKPTPTMMPTQKPPNTPSEERINGSSCQFSIKKIIIENTSQGTKEGYIDGNIYKMKLGQRITIRLEISQSGRCQIQTVWKASNFQMPLTTDDFMNIYAAEKLGNDEILISASDQLSDYRIELPVKVRIHVE